VVVLCLPTICIGNVLDEEEEEEGGTVITRTRTSLS